MDEDWGTEPGKDATKVRLREVLKPGKTVIDYTYDFGDGWEHKIVVSNVRAGAADVAYSRYLSGERNGPPEDCGGIPDFYDMLDAGADPKQPNHAHAKAWLDGYDPDELDDLSIKFALGRLAARRNAVAAPITKTSKA